MVAIFGILALAGLALFIRNNQQVLALLTLLLIVGTAYLTATAVEPQTDQLMLPGMIGILISLHLIVSRLIDNKWLKWLLPPASIAVLFATGITAGSYGGYALDFGSAKISGILFLGWLIGAILQLKRQVVQKWFPSIDQEELAKSVQLVTIALFIIPATFFASWFGLLLLATGFYMYSCYDEHRYSATTIALLAVSAFGYFAGYYQLDAIDLSIGKVMAGLFIGAAAVSLVHLARKGMPLWLSFGLLIGAGALLLLILLFNNVHPAYGGIEAFLAAIAGFAITVVVWQASTAAALLFPLMVVLGLTLPSDPFGDRSDAISVTASSGNSAQGTAGQESKSSFASVKGLDASDVSGVYRIDKETAVISFQLGPKGGVTKGEITGFEGKVEFTDDVENTRFEVTMPVKQLTTFNSMRDESLMEDIYFNEPKFPVMKYLSTKMTPKEDGYVLSGTFTMLGTSKPEEVFVKYLENVDGKLVFVGKSSIDKTKYGMASSPQEGDIVDFEFKIVLIK